MSTIAIDIDKAKLRDFCRKWKITEFALFGSAVKPEEFRADSDVDVLVSFAEDAEWGMFQHMEMQDELRAIFRREVDLLTRSGVEHMRNYLRRAAILESAVALDVA
jgi:predicted nucleotidyltransferase